jgi:hypothetical protein
MFYNILTLKNAIFADVIKHFLLKNNKCTMNQISEMKTQNNFSFSMLTN